jgi:hypothetical protein
MSATASSANSIQMPAAEPPAPAASSALSFAEVPSAVEEDFLTKVAEILERLKAQSEMRGHPLLASLIAIAKGEAEDDLRTRNGAFRYGGQLGEADDSVLKMAQRFACARRETFAVEERVTPAALLAFIRA